MDKNTKDPVLLASKLRTQLGHFVGLFDPSKLAIIFNDQKINKEMVKLSEHRSGDTGVSIYEVGGEYSLNLNHVFLKELSSQKHILSRLCFLRF